MRKLRNELCLYFFILGDFTGHLIDSICQLTNFIPVQGFDLYAITAAGNQLCLIGNFRYRLHDGPQIIVTAYQHHRQHSQKNTAAYHRHLNDLAIHLADRGYIPQNTNNLTIGIDHRTGNSHNALICNRIFSQIGF